MPDFDKVHEHARKLAQLTEPGKRLEGLASWCEFVAEEWRELVAMWRGDHRQRAIQKYAVQPCGSECLTVPPAVCHILCDREKGHEGHHAHFYGHSVSDGYRTWPNPQTEPVPLQ